MGKLTCELIRIKTITHMVQLGTVLIFKRVQENKNLDFYLHCSPNLKGNSKFCIKVFRC